MDLGWFFRIQLTDDFAQGNAVFLSRIAVSAITAIFCFVSFGT
jgi:hypothetical protein